MSKIKVTLDIDESLYNFYKYVASTRQPDPADDPRDDISTPEKLMALILKNRAEKLYYNMVPLMTGKVDIDEHVVITRPVDY